MSGIEVHCLKIEKKKKKRKRHLDSSSFRFLQAFLTFLTSAQNSHEGKCRCPSESCRGTYDSIRFLPHPTCLLMNFMWSNVETHLRWISHREPITHFSMQCRIFRTKFPKTIFFSKFLRLIFFYCLPQIIQDQTKVDTHFSEQYCCTKKRKTYVSFNTTFKINLPSHKFFRRNVRTIKVVSFRIDR